MLYIPIEGGKFALAEDTTLPSLLCLLIPFFSTGKRDIPFFLDTGDFSHEGILKWELFFLSIGNIIII